MGPFRRELVRILQNLTGLYRQDSRQRLVRFAMVVSQAKFSTTLYRMRDACPSSLNEKPGPQMPCHEKPQQVAGTETPSEQSLVFAGSQILGPSPQDLASQVLRLWREVIETNPVSENLVARFFRT